MSAVGAAPCDPRLRSDALASTWRVCDDDPARTDRRPRAGDRRGRAAHRLGAARADRAGPAGGLRLPRRDDPAGARRRLVLRQGLPVLRPLRDAVHQGRARQPGHAVLQREHPRRRRVRRHRPARDVDRSELPDPQRQLHARPRCPTACTPSTTATSRSTPTAASSCASGRRAHDAGPNYFVLGPKAAMLLAREVFSDWTATPGRLRIQRVDRIGVAPPAPPSELLGEAAGGRREVAGDAAEDVPRVSRSGSISSCR